MISKLPCLAILLLLAAAPVQAALTFYVSPPKVQMSTVSGVTTENFNLRAVGNVNGFAGAVGNYTTESNGGVVLPNDQYGGYQQGNYLGAREGATTKLMLTTPAKYFGFLWSAGDRGNGFEVKKNGVVLLSTTTAALINALPNTPGVFITAIDESTYATQAYYGQPTSGLNNSEPYAYLHIVGTGSTDFDEIVFTQLPNLGIFESDNHSLRAAAPVLPGTLVDMTFVIPEPHTNALMLLAGSVFIGWKIRRFRRNRR